MSGLLLRAGEIGGERIADVRVRGEQVVEIEQGLLPTRDETVIEMRGGAVLPGLHDHHLHLLSLAAAAGSVRCGPPEVTSADELTRALRTAPSGWVRGIGYHESVAGSLDRDVLDRMAGDRSVRVQHRSGALWMLNTHALTELHLGDEPGVELDENRRPTGRLWRADVLLRERIGRKEPPDLSAVGRRLASLGITGVTDATPNLAAGTIETLTGAVTSGALPQRLQLLGAPADTRLPARVGIGPHKILRPDHQPPDFDKLRAEIVRAHAGGRAVAVHAVTRESLVVALAVLGEVGALPGDRIEHAALVGQDMLSLLAETVPMVVTQPGFVAERGDQYRDEVPAGERDDLYRYASLLAVGISVAPSSDAPFANEDPWRTIAAATQRRTPSGAELGPGERVSAQQALDGYLTPLDDPGGRTRRIERGAPADLCLLREPLAGVLAAPRAELVTATVCAGRRVFHC